MSRLSADILDASNTDDENEDDVLLQRFDDAVAGDHDGGAAARAAMVFALGDLTLSPQRATEIIFAARADLRDQRDHSGDAEPPITTYDIIDAVLNLLEQRMEWTYVEGQWIPPPADHVDAAGDDEPIFFYARRGPAVPWDERPAP